MISNIRGTNGSGHRWHGNRFDPCCAHSRSVGSWRRLADFVRVVACGLAVVVAAALVPGAPAAVGSETASGTEQQHRASTRVAAERCGTRSSSGRSTPARRAGSPPRAWSTSTATAGRRSWRRSTRRSCSTRRAAGSARARRPRAASTRRRWSPTSTATACPRSWSAATGTVAAYDLRDGRLQLKTGGRRRPQRRPDAGGPRPRRRRPRRRRPGRGGGDDHQHLADRRAGLRLQRRAASSSSRKAATAGVAPLQPAAGPGNDPHFNGVGNHGYGAYGENVGIGNIDDDPELEIITTFDNHQINAFNLDGTSILASPWFTNRESGAEGRRMGWGQFIRWADPRVERRHYHLHTRRVAEPGAPAPGSSGRPRRRRSPTSTATAATRSSASPTSSATSRTAPRATRSWCSTARTATAPLGQAPPRVRDAADVEPPGAPARRRLVPAHGHPGADRGRHPRRPRGPRSSRRCPAARSTRSARRAHGSGRYHVRAAAREDLRLRGGRGRPQQGRHSRAGLRHLLARAATPGA